MNRLFLSLLTILHACASTQAPPEVNEANPEPDENGLSTLHAGEVQTVREIPMEHTSEAIATVAKSLSSQVDSILPPLQVLSECHALARAHEDVLEAEIGRTESGHPIKAYEFGHGQTHVLLYAFPDPGEAVGGTTILSLLHGLVNGNEHLLSLDVTWHFIPCLNLDDQPDGGRTLSAVFRDPRVREVDWCLSNPRSETTALLDYAANISPAFTFPLHDEYHSRESIPLYVIVCEPLDSAMPERIRTCMQSFGLLWQEENPHEVMGTGFNVLSDLAGAEYANSTFSILEKYGQVASCEVSQQEGVSAPALVAAQMSFGLIMLDAILQKQAMRTEPAAAPDVDKPRR
ncbi:MAG TPA: hypothetical protein HPP83_00700 [Candidatus Hydrogenedentes bacterium]|nr:hypothetical protein [Candidatus Hydrogenedentota bacterium]